VVREMSMRVEFDEPKCVAAGQCAMVAPDVFDQRDDDGVAILLDAEPGPEHHDEVREAAAVCPAAAIRLVER
jgi:ferredoxin